MKKWFAFGGIAAAMTLAACGGASTQGSGLDGEYKNTSMVTVCIGVSRPAGGGGGGPALYTIAPGATQAFVVNDKGSITVKSGAC